MPKKILIAENDQDILFILTEIFNNAGFTVESLPEATSIVTRKKDWPDLFILDKDMPTIDGLAVCKYLRLNKQTKNTPIIMISAYHKLKRKAREAGVNDFIEKPFDLSDLLNTVNKYIDIENEEHALH
jgi:DNA-binding response OmpR family regulator